MKTISNDQKLSLLGFLGLSLGAAGSMLSATVAEKKSQKRISEAVKEEVARVTAKLKSENDEEE